MVQLSYLYVVTRKTIALAVWTFVAKWMSLLFLLSSFVLAFLPRSRRLLISWLHSSSAVILEPWKVKSGAVSPFSISVGHETVCVLVPSQILETEFWMK